MDYTNNLKTYKKIGIAAFIGLTLIIGLITYLIIINVKSDSYNIKVQFLFIGDLKKGAPVRFIGGLKIGYVKDVYIKEQRIETILSIRNTFKLRKKADISIYGAGLLGDKFINVNQGPDSGNFVKPGEVLQGNNALGLEIIQQSFAKLSLAMGGEKIDEKKLKRFDIILNQLAKNLKILNYKIYNVRPVLKNSLLTGKNKTEKINNKIKQFRQSFSFINKLKNISESKIPINKIFTSLNKINKSLNDLNMYLTILMSNETLTQINDIELDKNNYIHELIYKDKLYTTLNDILEYTANFSETIADKPYKLFSSK